MQSEPSLVVHLLSGKRSKVLSIFDFFVEPSPTNQEQLSDSHIRTLIEVRSKWLDHFGFLIAVQWWTLRFESR